MSIFYRPRIAVNLDTNLIFVCPSGPTTSNLDPAVFLPGAADHAMLHGTIDLTLSFTQRLMSLTIKFTGLETVRFRRGGTEDSVTVEETIEVPLEPGGRMLGAGTHPFEFLFRIPRDTATHQRCTYGSVLHQVESVATFESWLAGSVRAVNDMPFVVCCSPSLTAPFSFEHHQHADGFGLITISARTPHLTVGGLLRLSIKFPSPSPTLILHSVDVTLLQKPSLRSRSKPGYVEDIPAERIPISQSGMSAGGQDLRRAEDDAGWDREWILRIPDDDHARPSSQPESDDAIRMAHELEVRLLYTQRVSSARAKKQVMVARCPLSLLSCMNAIPSAVLPLYSSDDPRSGLTPVFSLPRPRSHAQCACGQPLNALLAADVSLADTLPDTQSIPRRQQSQAEESVERPKHEYRPR